MAHRLVDRGEHRAGHRLLRAVLDAPTAARPPCDRWVHLHWHLLVFELGLSRWDDAHARYCTRIAPVVGSGLALSDAPSALWRLELARPGRSLEWAPVRDVARLRLARPASAGLVFHQLLALAGAGDLPVLDRWLALHPDDAPLTRAARGLRAFAAEDYESAAHELDAVDLAFLRTDASAAQASLVRDIARAACARSQARDRRAA